MEKKNNTEVSQEKLDEAYDEYQRIKQRELEKYERIERNSSAKNRNPMKHLTPKKKKRK
jgi:hypothetical protein